MIKYIKILDYNSSIDNYLHNYQLNTKIYDKSNLDCYISHLNNILEPNIYHILTKTNIHILLINGKLILMEKPDLYFIKKIRYFIQIQTKHSKTKHSKTKHSKTKHSKTKHHKTNYLKILLFIDDLLLFLYDHITKLNNSDKYMAKYISKKLNQYINNQDTINNLYMICQYFIKIFKHHQIELDNISPKIIIRFFYLFFLINGLK